MILLNWIDFNIPIELSHSFEWNSLIECIDLIELNNRIELNWISQRLGLLTLNKQQQYARWHRVAQQQLCVWEAIESNWIQSPLPTQKKPFNYENAGHFNAPLLPTAPSLRIIFIFPFFFFFAFVCVCCSVVWLKPQEDCFIRNKAVDERDRYKLLSESWFVLSLPWKDCHLHLFFSRDNYARITFFLLLLPASASVLISLFNRILFLSELLFCHV